MTHARKNGKRLMFDQVNETTVVIQYVDRPKGTVARGRPVGSKNKTKAKRTNLRKARRVNAVYGIA
jgi:hypothetical protein